MPINTHAAGAADTMTLREVLEPFASRARNASYVSDDAKVTVYMKDCRAALTASLATASPAPGALADLRASIADIIGQDYAEASRGAPDHADHCAGLICTLIASSSAASAPPVDGGGRERIVQIVRSFIKGKSQADGSWLSTLNSRTDPEAIADAILAHPSPAAGAAGLVGSGIARALETADWSNVSIGNKALISAAVTALARHATPDGDAVTLMGVPLTEEQEAEMRSAEADLATPQGAGETAGGREFDLVDEWLAWNLNRPLKDSSVGDTTSIHALRELVKEQIGLSVEAAIATAAPEQDGSRGWTPPTRGSVSDLIQSRLHAELMAFFADRLPEPPATARPHSDAEGR